MLQHARSPLDRLDEAVLGYAMAAPATNEQGIDIAARMLRRSHEADDPPVAAAHTAAALWRLRPATAEELDVVLDLLPHGTRVTGTVVSGLDSKICRDSLTADLLVLGHRVSELDGVRLSPSASRVLLADERITLLCNLLPAGDDEVLTLATWVGQAPEPVLALRAEDLAVRLLDAENPRVVRRALTPLRTEWHLWFADQLIDRMGKRAAPAQVAVAYYLAHNNAKPNLHPDACAMLHDAARDWVQRARANKLDMVDELLKAVSAPMAKSWGQQCVRWCAQPRSRFSRRR